MDLIRTGLASLAQIVIDYEMGAAHFTMRNSTEVDKMVAVAVGDTAAEETTLTNRITTVDEGAEAAEATIPTNNREEEEVSRSTTMHRMTYLLSFVATTNCETNAIMGRNAKESTDS